MTAPAPEQKPTQAEFEENRRKVRQSIFVAAGVDIVIAIVALSWGVPIVAGALAVMAFVGTPLVLSNLDRGWRKQGYEIP